MKQLTKAEEQIMKHLWEMEEATVQNILEKFDSPKPARTTVATILSILENKGFVAHKKQDCFGQALAMTQHNTPDKTQGKKLNVYYALIQKEDYSKSQLTGIMKDYFNNSFASMASFFVKENNLSLQELDELLEETREELKKEEEGKNHE